MIRFRCAKLNDMAIQFLHAVAYSFSETFYENKYFGATNGFTSALNTHDHDYIHDHNTF